MNLQDQAALQGSQADDPYLFGTWKELQQICGALLKGGGEGGGRREREGRKMRRELIKS